MGRSLRVDAAGAWHHVMNRGAGRRIVVRDDADRECFVELLSQLKERFGVEVHCFCLMGNHFHLLVRSADGRLSEAMKWLGSVYTREVNASRGTDGAIFRGRFHSILVERESHLIWLFRYINANPLDLGWTGPLAAYPWSGLGTSLGRTSRYPWLHTTFFCDVLGSTHDAETFVESARVESRARPRSARYSFDEVVEAATVASGPGPGCNTTPQIHSAATVVAIDELGCDSDVVLGDRTTAAARRVALHRARAAVRDDPAVRALAERAVSVLTVGLRVTSGV